MKAPLQKVVPGQQVNPIQAASWNALVDAAQSARMDRGKGTPNVPDNPATADTVLIACQTAVPVPWFGIVALPLVATMPIPPASAEFLQRVVIAGQVPSDAGQPFAILLDAAQAQSAGMTAIVRGVVSGAVQCQVNVTDPGHTWAQTASGNVSYLFSCPAGTAGSVPILQRQSGTGVQWCTVLLPATSDVDFSSTASLANFTYDASGSFTDHGTFGSTDFSYLDLSVGYDPGNFWSAGTPDTLTTTPAYKGTYLIYGSVTFGPGIAVTAPGLVGIVLYVAGSINLQTVPLEIGTFGAATVSLTYLSYMDGGDILLGVAFAGGGSDPGGPVTGYLSLLRLGS
jgi:hypothetical protein